MSPDSDTDIVSKLLDFKPMTIEKRTQFMTFDRKLFFSIGSLFIVFIAIILLFEYQLEKENRQTGTLSGKTITEGAASAGGMQLSFFQLDDPVLCQIRDEILNLDVNNLTPLEALNKLNEIKKITGI